MTAWHLLLLFQEFDQLVVLHLLKLVEVERVADFTTVAKRGSVAVEGLRLAA